MLLWARSLALPALGWLLWWEEASAALGRLLGAIRWWLLLWLVQRLCGRGLRPFGAPGPWWLLVLRVVLPPALVQLFA